MPRKRRAGKRGTRFTSGQLSGTTLAQIDGGENTQYVRTFAEAAGVEVTDGIADSASNAPSGICHLLTISTGLSCVSTFDMQLYGDLANGGGASYCSWAKSATAGVVTGYLFASTGVHANTVVASKGVSVYWEATGSYNYHRQ